MKVLLYIGVVIGVIALAYIPYKLTIWLTEFIKWIIKNTIKFN